MQKKQKFRLILFIGTFALIFGSVFGVFELLEYLGNLSTPAAAANVGSAGASSTLPELADLLAEATSDASTSIITSTSGLALASATSIAVPVKATKKKVSGSGAAVSVATIPSSAPTENAIALISAPANIVSANDRSQLALSLNSLSSLVTILGNSQIDTTTAVSTPPPVATSTETATSTSAAASSTVAVASTTIASTTSASSTVSSTIALPYSASDFTDLAGWQHEWGSVNATNGTLSIGAATTTTGGEALLTNSAGWTDYLATIDFSWQKGETFSIIARYQPNRNNVSCEFMNNGETSVYETINGQRSLLGMGTAANFTPTQTTTVAWIRVKGDRVGCGLDNSIVNDYMYRGLSPVLLSGGLDLETWDPTPNNAQILVQDINVVSLQ